MLNVTKMVLQGAFTSLAILVCFSSTAVAGNSRSDANELQKQGYGQVDKSDVQKDANFDDDFAKFRADGTYSRARTIGVGYAGGYSRASFAAPRRSAPAQAAAPRRRCGRR